jgi:hypothetical protein
MLKHYDHVTVAVTDLDAARRFFRRQPHVVPAPDVARLDRIGSTTSASPSRASMP